MKHSVRCSFTVLFSFGLLKVPFVSTRVTASCLSFSAIQQSSVPYRPIHLKWLPKICRRESPAKLHLIHVGCTSDALKLLSIFPLVQRKFICVKMMFAGSLKLLFEVDWTFFYLIDLFDKTIFNQVVLKVIYKNNITGKLLGRWLTPGWCPTQFQVEDLIHLQLRQADLSIQIHRLQRMANNQEAMPGIKAALEWRRLSEKFQLTNSSVGVYYGRSSATLTARWHSSVRSPMKNHTPSSTITSNSFEGIVTNSSRWTRRNLSLN